MFRFLLFVCSAYAIVAADNLRAAEVTEVAEVEETSEKSLDLHASMDLQSIPVDDVKGASLVKRLKRVVLDHHKKSRASLVRGTIFSDVSDAKAETTSTTSTTSRRLLESADGWEGKFEGFTQFKARPNADCSGVIQTIEGVTAGLCYQDKWASSWIQVGCASKGDQRALMFKQFALSEGGCTGTPFNTQVDDVMEQCAFNTDSTMAPLMRAVQCASHMDDGKAGWRGEVYDNMGCTGKPLSYHTTRMDSCTLDVDYNGDDVEDVENDEENDEVEDVVTAATTFRYVKFVKCDAADGRITVVAHTDSQCTRPIWKTSFAMDEPVDQCTYTGEGSLEPFEGDYVKYTCYNP
jgi:hypothetical protein